MCGEERQHQPTGEQEPSLGDEDFGRDPIGIYDFGCAQAEGDDDGCDAGEDAQDPDPGTFPPPSLDGRNEPNQQTRDHDKADGDRRCEDTDGDQTEES